MDDTINAIGTVITIVVLTVAIILIPSIWVKAFAGLGVVHTMMSHDTYIKMATKKENEDEAVRSREFKEVSKWMDNNKKE